MSVRRQESSMKSELYGMFEADQGERQSHPPVGTSEYRELRTRDAECCQRVAELMAAGEILRCAQDDNGGQEPDPSLRSG